ncbi:GNS1/SUR4 family protein [Toxoplasma gondii TgCatPRC2]|uniref:Elongation of fatty acids protein n=1 Tax=Toxoplasma gondii TgCatPRC2 TaxID=1130821 RepID=A0A151HDQ3_TOXGO|nr:GNS1/SUR4 family protein [Toxoplasma gondii TgCatPRC2]
MWSLWQLFHFYCLRPTGGADLARVLQVPIFVACALYVPVVYGLQWYMRNRPAYKLKTACFVWNLALSLLSLLGFFVMLVAQPVLLTKAIFPETQFVPPVRAVICFFTLTKAIEFGDTIILCLRKKPLIFLHVYHHLTVTLYCWHAQLVTVSMGHNFAFINLGIHGVMYLYYAFSVLQARHPILLACRPYITLSQTVQMFVGLFLSYEALVSDLPASEHLNANIALAMYASYFVLFGKFYVEAYMRHLRPKTTQLIVTVHTLAIGGLWILWGHKRRLAVAVELLVFSGATAIVLPLVRKAYAAALRSCARAEAQTAAGEAFSPASKLTPSLAKVGCDEDSDAAPTEADTAPGSPDVSPSKCGGRTPSAAEAAPVCKEPQQMALSEPTICNRTPSPQNLDKAPQQPGALGTYQAALTISNFLLSWAVEGMMTAAALAQSDSLSWAPGTPRASSAFGMKRGKAKACESSREDLEEEEPEAGPNRPRTGSETHAHFRIFDGLFALIQKPAVQTETSKAPPAKQLAATAESPKPPQAASRPATTSPTGSDSTAQSTTRGQVTPKSLLGEEGVELGACIAATESAAGEATSNCGGATSRALCAASATRVPLHSGKGPAALPRHRGPFGSFMDIVLVVLSFAIPSMYGWIAHGSCLLGLCVFGALRWIIELYTSDTLIKAKVPGAECLCALAGGSLRKRDTRRGKEKEREAERATKRVTCARGGGGGGACLRRD